MERSIAERETRNRNSDAAFRTIFRLSFHRSEHTVHTFVFTRQPKNLWQMNVFMLREILYGETCIMYKKYRTDLILSPLRQKNYLMTQSI
jgi:hypothetical protein